MLRLEKKPQTGWWPVTSRPRARGSAGAFGRNTGGMDRFLRQKPRAQVVKASPANERMGWATPGCPAPQLRGRGKNPRIFPAKLVGKVLGV